MRAQDKGGVAHHTWLYGCGCGYGSMVIVMMMILVPTLLQASLTAAVDLRLCCRSVSVRFSALALEAMADACLAEEATVIGRGEPA